MCHNVTNAPKDTLFLELMPEVNVNVTVTRKQKYPNTKFGISSSNNIEDMLSRTQFFLAEARGQGHSEPKTVCDTLGPQNVATD